MLVFGAAITDAIDNTWYQDERYREEEEEEEEGTLHDAWSILWW